MAIPMSTKARQNVAFYLLLSLMLLYFSQGIAVSVDNVPVRAAPLQESSQISNGMVRVYLSSLGNPTWLNLTVCGNYSTSNNAVNLSNGSKITIQFNASDGCLTLMLQGQTYQMGRSFSLHRQNADGNNSLMIQQAKESANPYPGDLSFQAVAGSGGYTLYTIAHVYIEDYLYGVVPYEMSNAASLEALKAQAVAARTYTVRMMKTRATGLYDVKDTTSDQVYRGTPSGYNNCKQAVDTTKGIVLMYEGGYITTFYSASNGGQTETSRSGAGYAYMPVKDDPFDFANPNATLKKKTIYQNLQSPLNPSGLIELLKSKALVQLQRNGYAATPDNTALKTLQSITPHTPMYTAPSRLYTKLDFTVSLITQNAFGIYETIEQTVTCDIFGELESLLSLGLQTASNELWTVSQSGDNFVIQARRYGHGMGMSQCGAMHMGKLGYSYDQILGFYYEGCTQIRHHFTSSVLSMPFNEETTFVTPAVSNDSDKSSSDGTSKSSSNVIGYATVTANDFVNLRQGPSMESSILGTAPAGAMVSILSQEGAWAHVQYYGLTAYANTGFLSRLSGSIPTSHQEEVSTTHDAPENMPYSKKECAIVSTQNDALNMRAAPRTGSAIITTIPRLATVNITSREGNWFGVSYEGYTGYVLASFLTILDTNDYHSEPGWQKPDSIAWVETISGSLNLRSEAFNGSRIVCQIPKGESVRLRTHGAQWCGITYQGMNGYVMTRYLRFDNQPTPGQKQPTSAASAAQTAMIITGGGALNLRAEASQWAQIIAQIPQYTTVHVIGTHGEWTQVSYNGQQGYVVSRFLQTDAHQTAVLPKLDEQNDQAEPLTVWINTRYDALNLRSEANANAAILTTLPKGSEVQLLVEGNEWSLISAQGLQGYVMTRYLSAECPAWQAAEAGVSTEPSKQPLYNEISAGKALVNGIDEMPLWSYATQEGQPIAYVPAGESVQILFAMDDWRCVDWSGIVGYCRIERLAMSE